MKKSPLFPLAAFSLLPALLAGCSIFDPSASSGQASSSPSSSQASSVAPASSESVPASSEAAPASSEESLPSSEASPVHEHVWDEGVFTRYPTILEEGEKTFTCACGEKRTEAVPKVVDQTAYTEKAVGMDGLPGVFSMKAKVGASKDNAENPATIGVPLVAKQNLADYPTYATPGIIQGAAINYEVKTGPTTYEPIPGKELLAPYSYFRWSVMKQTSTSADGVVTTFDKLSGFDGSYYIVRIDVSDIIAGKSGYLHVSQESNKAMMVALGMGGGVDTGEKATDAAGKATTAPSIKDGYWYVGEKNTGIPVAANHTASQAYAGTNGNWYVGATSFGFGQGSKVASYTIENNGAALKDSNGNYRENPYIDIILLSSSKLAAGADTGITGMPSADIPVSFYIDDTFDYNPSLVYDPTSTDPNHATEVAKKYFDDTKIAEGSNATSYIVKGSDLEIDVETTETHDADEIHEYWSLDRAINYPDYNAHTLRLICEVPVLEGLRVTGTADNPRSIALNVNSFDIQIANHSQTGAAGLAVDNYATLTLLDKSNTVGAELAIGNNAKMEVLSGGTLIIDKTCCFEVEYDAASKAVPTKAVTVDELIKKIDALPQSSEVNESHRASIEEAKGLYDLLSAEDKALVTNYQHLVDCIAALPAEVPLNNGEVFVRSGGKIINRGIVNIEGLEGKPNQSSATETAQQTVRDMRSAALIIEEGGELENEGCLSVKGDLYVMGKLINRGNYEDVIQGQDPDKGTVDHHRGIQVTWKDDMTMLKEGSTTEYIVNPDVKPGTLHVGIDADGNKVKTAELVNYGDIVLVPGKMEVYGIFRNLETETRAGAVYLVTVSEAVVPITPTAENPTKLEERRTFTPPYEPVFDYLNARLFENAGTIAKANIELIGNGLFGKLTPIA